MKVGYGLKYTGWFSSQSNKRCEVNIYQKDYTGVSSEIAGFYSPYIKIQQISEGVFVGTKCSLTIKATESYQYMPMFMSPLGTYVLEVLVENQIEYRGIIQPSYYREKYAELPYAVSITAIDGLGLLKDSFVEAVVDVDKASSLYEVAFQILQSKTFVDKLYMDVEMMAENKTELLLHPFWNDYTAEWTAYEVLEGILKGIGCFIVQFRNKWIVTSWDKITRYRSAEGIASLEKNVFHLNTKGENRLIYSGTPEVGVYPGIKEIQFVHDNERNMWGDKQVLPRMKTIEEHEAFWDRFSGIPPSNISKYTNRRFEELNDETVFYFKNRRGDGGLDPGFMWQSQKKVALLDYEGEVEVTYSFDIMMESNETNKKWFEYLYKRMQERLEKEENPNIILVGPTTDTFRIRTNWGDIFEIKSDELGDWKTISYTSIVPYYSSYYNANLFFGLQWAGSAVGDPDGNSFEFYIRNFAMIFKVNSKEVKETKAFVYNDLEYGKAVKYDALFLATGLSDFEGLSFSYRDNGEVKPAQNVIYDGIKDNHAELLGVRIMQQQGISQERFKLTLNRPLTLFCLLEERDLGVFHTSTATWDLYEDKMQMDLVKIQKANVDELRIRKVINDKEVYDKRIFEDYEVGVNITWEDGTTEEKEYKIK